MGDKHPLAAFLVFTAVCLGFAVWIVTTIGNIALFADRTSYQAEFTDVTGLLVNDAVKVSGVTVGKVTAIEVVPGGTALVTFEVEDSVPVTEDSVVSVRWRDVFGLRFVYVSPGDGRAAEAGYAFGLRQTRSPADLGVLLQRLVPVMSALDPQLQNQVLEALSDALVGNEQEVRDLIAEGASLTQALASRENEIDRLIANSATVLDAYATREQQLRGFLDSFAEVSTTVAARNDALEDAIVTLADAQDTLAERVDANDEELKATFDALERTTDVLAVNRDNLEDLIETAGKGLVSYHLISRVGQWFNVRAVGFSDNYETISAERGATLPPPRQGQSGANLGSFFGAGAPAAGGGR